MALYRGQRHVDLSDDKLQNMSDHGWRLSYNQRALLVKMMCCAVRKRHSDSNLQIQGVKLITREQTSKMELEYEWPDPNLPCSLDEFFAKVNKHLGKFEKSEIKNEYWNIISNYIEPSNYKYRKNHNEEGWTTRTNMTREEVDEQLAQMSAEQKTYISLFGAALKSDMKDGPAKIWMQKLIEILLHSYDDLSTLNILCLAPSFNCSTSTELETIYDDLESPSIQHHYKETFSSSSLPNLSSSSLESSDGSTSNRSIGGAEGYKRQKVVPDLCVLLPKYPGAFPLVVELKSACQEPLGFVQNLQQMLSKLFSRMLSLALYCHPGHTSCLLSLRKTEIYISHVQVKYVYTNLKMMILILIWKHLMKWQHLFIGS